MIDLPCPSPDCHEAIELDDEWERLGETVVCECGTSSTVEYEETWDGEEEHQYWFLTQKAAA